MPTNDPDQPDSPTPEGEKPPESPRLPPFSEESVRKFTVDVSEGLDEAFKKLKDRAGHYYKKGQHTQVRVKFRGKELATMPLAMLMAVEAATWVWAGPIRLLVANALGRTLLDVEIINEADNVVAQGKERLLDGELDEALARFRQAIEMDRDHPGAHLNLGIALKLKGDREAATAAFEKALSLDPAGETGVEARKQIEKMKARGG